jgi:hypothetical protein
MTKNNVSLYTNNFKSERRKNIIITLIGITVIIAIIGITVLSHVNTYSR